MKLIIRKMREKDLEPLHRLLSDPQVMKYLEPPFTEEKTEAFLKNCGMKEEPLVYTVEDENGFAGYVIYHRYDQDSMEIGWVLYPEHWGKGYASELTEQLIEKAQMAKKALIIECDPGQSKSRHIAKKYGFTCLGEKDGLMLFRLDP